MLLSFLYSLYSLELISFKVINVGKLPEISEQTLSLSVGSYYLTWYEAEAYLNKYAKVVGFSLRRKRFKTDENDAVPLSVHILVNL